MIAYNQTLSTLVKKVGLKRARSQTRTKHEECISAQITLLQHERDHGCLIRIH